MHGRSLFCGTPAKEFLYPQARNCSSSTTSVHDREAFVASITDATDRNMLETIAMQPSFRANRLGHQSEGYDRGRVQNPAGGTFPSMASWPFTLARATRRQWASLAVGSLARSYRAPTLDTASMYGRFASACCFFARSPSS